MHLPKLMSRKRRSSVDAVPTASKKSHVQIAQPQVPEIVDLTMDDDEEESDNSDVVFLGTNLAPAASPARRGKHAVSTVTEVDEDGALARSLPPRRGAKGNRESYLVDGRTSSPMTTDLTMEGHAGPSRSTLRTPISVESAEGSPNNLDTQTKESPAVDRKQELRAYEHLFTDGFNCPGCAQRLKPNKEEVTYKNVSPPPPLVSLLHLSCHKCRATYCRGCQQVVKCKSNCPGKGKRPACEVLNCCAAAHAIGLFAALGALDKAYIRRRGTSDSRRSLRVRKKATVSLAGLLKQSKTSNSGSGIGYGSDFSTKRTSVDTAAVKKANSEAKAWDSLAKTAFETIALFLPDAYRDDPRPLDLLPHESIRSMLPLSYLPEIIAEFLRNDNITDWTARSPLYNALLNLLKRLADSELSVGLLIEGRTEKKHSDGIDAWMTKSGEIEWERQADGSTGEARSPLAGLVQRPPLYEHFKKLTRQCEAFTAGASHLVDDHGNEEGPAPEEDVVSTLGICMTIISTKEAIERAIGAWQRHGRGDMDDSAASVTSKGKGKSRDTVVSTEAAYIAAWEKLAFAYLELPRVPLYPATVVATSPAIRSYSYTNEVQSTSSSTRIPKQRFHLVKELGVMSTSLPVGIWVRVDEVRNDAIKIMIAGPAGTPYEGGLFEFDCFIPLDYPKKPPLMTLCTTASGQVRFNPNLYANGKVCLSLLGTWAGRPEELWSTKSTLLQVLISIQSMIFNEAPMYNEPGYGHAVQTDPRSIEYNKNVALQNVRWAMVEWMKDDRKHDLWADVIKSHFSIHRKLIREKIQRWAQADARFGAYLHSSVSSCGSYTAGHGPAYANSAGPPANGLDLLDAFDKGCTTVAKWDFTRDI